MPVATAVADPQPAAAWLGVAIVTAGFVAYANSLSGPFVFDDQLSIVENASIRRWWQPGAVLFPERELPVAGRPLVNLSFALNYALGGLNVFGYHLVNVALHVLCALLVFGLVRRTLRLAWLAQGRPFDLASLAQGRPFDLASLAQRKQSTNVAFVAALLWTLHPLTTEAVNYVTQRTELMMAVFYLLTLDASSRAWRDTHARRWHTVAIVSCAAGMACKESMVTAPLMVVLYDTIFLFGPLCGLRREFGTGCQVRIAVPGARSAPKGYWRPARGSASISTAEHLAGSLKLALVARWRFYAGLAASWLLLIALMWSGPRIHSAGFSSGVSPWVYLLNQTVMITQYLWLSVWPQSLVANYGWPVAVTLADVLPYAIFIVALLVLTIAAVIRYPALGFLGAWFFITLAPTSSIVPIATEVGAERRMYLPLIAVIVLLVVSVARLKRRPAMAAVAVLACAAALGVGTMARNRDYGSALQLARTTVERRPTSVGRHALATELLNAGAADEAMVHLRQAVDGAPRARFTLGVELLKQGDTNAAIDELQHFLREQPLLLEAVSARQLLGQALAQQQQWPQAIEQYRRVLSMNPSRTQRLETQALLGMALVRTERYDEAVSLYRAYLEERPGDIDALSHAGIALLATNNLDEGLGAFRRAVELAPDNGEMRRNLAAALFDRREIEEAAVHAERAIAVQPADATAHDLFGRILAVQGDFAGARAQFERALQIAPDDPDAKEDLAKLQRLMATSRN